MQDIFKSWRNYKILLESKFLKDVHTLGYIEKNFYPGIESVLSGFTEDVDYMQDDQHLIWNFQNESLTEKLNDFTFVAETQVPFNLKFLNFTREPIKVEAFNFSDFPRGRVNHYMIKENNSGDFNFGELEDNEDIKAFVQSCYSKANEMGLDPDNRYSYLTIDQLHVKGGESQRESGWHIDGMQGIEVPEKKDPDFQFIWADNTPTRFCTQTFNMQGANEAIHNIFKWVGRQVDENLCYYLKANEIYLMNAYHVHTAVKGIKPVFRRFVRLSFTNTPITSTRMTKNPKINYNYPIGTTTGAIPKNLKQ